MPRRIVINRCYGGFSLSGQAKDMYLELTKDAPRSESFFIDQDIARDDPVLLDIIEKIGLQAAGGGFSKLKIIQIPDDVPADGWIVNDYDGMEWVAEKHRTWCDETLDESNPQPE
jgi:hypothetical protein